MLITEKNKLKKYNSEHRIWQGIPSIEVTKKGRIFLTFYSGGIKEEIENYSFIIKSDDGENFSEPIAVAYLENHRCYDPCLWIDPLGRLWFTWALATDHAVYGSICNDPDADELVWSEPFEIGGEVMMNKPVVLTTGEWLFPTAVWKNTVHAIGTKYNSKDEDRLAFAYKSVDNGKTIEKLGGVDVPDRCFDEHMILELNDGTLAMYVRTFYGIGVSYSYDRGKTWTPGVDSGIKGPCSRFHIRRLKSGRVLLINHINFTGRNNLASMLSEDDGKTWKYTLMLDERSDVSYPDATENEDGYIYITYDRERGGFLNSMDEVYKCAREILVAKITEDDIIAGKLVSPCSKLKVVASKLGKYADEHKNPFGEFDKYTDAELAKNLSGKSAEDIISTLFEHYQINCMNMYKLDSEKLDKLIDVLNTDKNDETTVKKIISLIRSVSSVEKEPVPVVERIKEIIIENLENDVTVNEIADKTGMSIYYMAHLFKKVTGLTVTDYRNSVKLSKAKDMLIHSDKKISDIAHDCGFGSSSYFSKIFLASEKVSPTRYRHLLRNSDKQDKDVIYYNMLPNIDFLSNPDIEVEKNDDIHTYTVTMPDDEYAFLHEATVIEYHGRVFASWYNNTKHELHGRTPIRFATSDDNGKTWSEPEIVADDESGNILFCPPVFGIDDDTLYLFLNQMVSADHIHSLDLYKYNETENRFELLWSRPIPFKLNTNVYKLNNGKLMLMGRIGKLDEFPNTPAVLISDSGKIDAEWCLVKIQEDGNIADGAKFIHPEASAIIDGDTVYSFVRNDERKVPVVFISKDNCETWSGPIAHDIPLSDTKIYSGTLSDGRNYVIGNIAPGREHLALFISEPGTMKFYKAVTLQNQHSDELGMGWVWHYPVAYESDGKLYVIYTVNTTKEFSTLRGAVISVIDITKI